MDADAEAAELGRSIAREAVSPVPTEKFAAANDRLMELLLKASELSPRQQTIVLSHLGPIWVFGSATAVRTARLDAARTLMVAMISAKQQELALDQAVEDHRAAQRANALTKETIRAADRANRIARHSLQATKEANEQAQLASDRSEALTREIHRATSLLTVVGLVLAFVTACLTAAQVWIALRSLGSD